MIVHENDPLTGLPIEQGSQTWLDLRTGIPTASEFDNIVLPSGKLSASARGYMARLLAERVTRMCMMDIGNLEWVERGHALEATAAEKFESTRRVTTRKVAFITTDDGRWGASPDRIISDGTMLEIKCPKENTQMLYWMDGFGKNYKVQVQGQMMVGESDMAIRFAYHPELPWVEQRTTRDEPFIATLRATLTEFSDELDRHTERLKAEGYIQERLHVVGAAELAYADPDDIDKIVDSYFDISSTFTG